MSDERTFKAGDKLPTGETFICYTEDGSPIWNEPISRPVSAGSPHDTREAARAKYRLGEGEFPHDTREVRPDVEAPLVVWEYAFSLERRVDALVGELDTLRAERDAETELANSLGRDLERLAAEYAERESLMLAEQEAEVVSLREALERFNTRFRELSVRAMDEGEWPLGGRETASELIAALAAGSRVEDA